MRARGTLTRVLLIVDHLRRRFGRFKLCAHLLNLRCNAFEGGGHIYRHSALITRNDNLLCIR